MTVTKQSFPSLLFFYSAGALPSVQLLRSCPSEQGWLVFLFSKIDSLVWRHLTNAPTLPASHVPDVLEKLPKTVKRAHFVRSRIMVFSGLDVPGTSPYRGAFSCLVDLLASFLYAYFTEVLITTLLPDISRTETKLNMLLRCQSSYHNSAFFTS